MRILFVALPNSIHTARWIGQLSGQGWDLQLFPSTEPPLHSLLRALEGYALPNHAGSDDKSSLSVIGGWQFSHLTNWGAWTARQMSRGLTNRAAQLARVIRRFKPDLIHTMEIQHAAYLAVDARAKFSAGRFPPWLVSNWGSDISLFGQLPHHAEKINKVLSACDYYHCECQRDVALGWKFGFRGKVMPVFCLSGGFELEEMSRLRQPGPTSSRRRITLKGYQHFAGRALVGLRAIERCADALQGYTISVYTASPDVRLAAELVREKTGIFFEIESNNWTRSDILRMHGSARISIGLSIGDGISTSLLEAMIMGAFPVQSNTGCGDEWITCGENGFLVEPNDPESVAAALRRALADDAMVDQAAETNARLAVEQLDVSVVRPQAVRMYEEIAEEQRVAMRAKG